MAEAVFEMDNHSDKIESDDEMSLKNYSHTSNYSHQRHNLVRSSVQMPLEPIGIDSDTHQLTTAKLANPDYRNNTSGLSRTWQQITPYTHSEEALALTPCLQPLQAAGLSSVQVDLTCQDDCSLNGQHKISPHSQVRETKYPSDLSHQSSANRHELNSFADRSQYSRSQVRTKKKLVVREISSDHTTKSDTKHSSKSFPKKPKSDPSSSERMSMDSNTDSSLALDQLQSEPRFNKKQSRSRHKYSRDLQQSPATFPAEQRSSTNVTSGSDNGQVSRGKLSYKSKQSRHSHTKVKVESKQTSSVRQVSGSTGHNSSINAELDKPTKLHSGKDKQKERAKRKQSFSKSSDGQRHQATNQTELTNVSTSKPKQHYARSKQRGFKSKSTGSDDNGKLPEAECTTDAVSESDYTKGEFSKLTVTSESLLKQIETKTSECIQYHKREIAKLRKKLTSATKVQNFSSELDVSEALDKHLAEKEIIRVTIDEMRSRQKVFLHYCEQIETRLNELSKAECSNPFMLESLYSTFKREVSRYDKGLPIYAHRLTILAMLHCNQVSVLIGETGSGKSTQLVQYLYEAGYSWYGLIACTQPRKLAAASLAQHVSKEVNEKLGETYDYIDSKRMQSKCARVVFMTDYMLLNQCIADPYLRKYSCLVIDEAHERSIHTDILIALIKQCLLHRPDLRVIITSATIDPTLFSHYFGGDNECPIIEVPGRVYPVQITWSVPQPSIVEQDYVSEAVSKVYDIHISNRKEQGDVLVFLTCPAEIERACKLAQQLLKKEAVILPLHGKLQPEEQQKVFQPTPGKRKVIFATNVAETSITIPGIVYVVDTGLSKELCYDPQKNMNSLEIRPISKSSADQRKGRAGRTCPGECYRIYSEEDYLQMKDNSVPEILRITLAFAVMKLYEFGIKEIHSFEFVESPDRKALDDAIENLKFLGAIKRGKLTELGRKMAMLPLEPNLSKVLFDAINKGIGLEAAAAVSISTLAGRVFFRPDTTESRAESDKKKLPFCQPTGDQMTYLHTYFEWSQRQGRKDQTKWCVENYVNAKSMRMVQQIVDELRFILVQKWHNNLPPKIRSLEEADALLPKIFFDAFATNICVHLGHSAVGYWSDKLPDEQLVIYPASSLKQLNSVPQCVVYEKTHKTSQHFLLQALPVREEWIQEAIKSGKLMCHPADHSLYNFYKVEPLKFTNLGPWIAVQLYHKYPQDRRITVPEFYEFDIQPVFEHSKQKATLEIFVQQQNHDQLQKSVTAHIESLKQQLRDKTHTCGITESNNNVKIILGLGGCIEGILMPGDVQTVVVRGINDEEEISQVMTELSGYGECTFDSSSNERGIQLFVKFRNPSDASKALTHHFNRIHEPNDLRIHKYQEQSRRNYCLKLEWCRRKRRPYAYINFSEDLICASNVFSFRTEEFHDIKSNLDFIVMIDRNSIKVEGPNIEIVSEEYIISRVLQLRVYPKCKQSDISVHFLYEESFEETDETFSLQQRHLETILSQCIPPDHYNVILEYPQPKRVMYKAQIYFDESSDCSKMYRYLREEVSDSTSDSSNDDNDDNDGDYQDDPAERVLRRSHPAHPAPSNAEYKVELVLTYSARYTPRFFSAIEREVSSVKQQFLLTDSCVMIDYSKRDRWGNIFVNLTASEHRAFQSAKAELEKVAEPSVVHCKTPLENQYVSTAAFQVTLKELQDETSTFIKTNESSLRMTTIAIYGTKKHRKVARKKIQAHLQSISHSEIHCFEINLKTYSPGLMKLLVEKYGCDTKQLCETASDEIVATSLVPRQQILTLFATEAGYDSILSLLSKLNPDTTIIQAKKFNETNVGVTSDCCVCFDNLSLKQARPVSYYRLESCGHAYCKECIKQQLQPNTIIFPVICAAVGCEAELVWKDFENLFKFGVKKLEDIASASLNAYLSANPDKVHNCITPDCKMVYFVAEVTKMFVCSECKVKICASCHSKWHEGYTCDENKNQSDTDSYRMWTLADKANNKRCPRCKVFIQKTGGCQHVTCCCGCHICWKCMKYFPSEQKCYGHLRKEHGSFM